MFSMKEKQLIAAKIEDLLLNLNHPEMPKEKPLFTLKVFGKENWSYAEIAPNWMFTKDVLPNINPFNEKAREILKEDDDEKRT